MQGDYDLWTQPETDLGTRMQQFFEYAFEYGAHQVILIGSDSPTLPKRFINDAFDSLSRCDVVLGPASDGGYYLIGQSGRSRSLFDNVEWSTPAVLSQSISRIHAASATLELLPPWYDVDDLNSVQMLKGHLEGLAASGKWQDSETLQIIERYWDQITNQI